MDNTLSSTLIWMVIIGMGLTNFAFRFTPLAILSRMDMPEPIMRWLSFIPISVMGALFAKTILLPSLEYVGEVPLFANPGIWGGIGAMIMFRLTKSFMISSVFGVVVYVLLRFMLGM
ncbi:MAG: AzlD domain-containing protein [Actinomycetia bacterium]|nr:AzlD domain-containing protein [Actinomycetes bacterium]